MDKCYYGFLKDTNELCNSSSGGFGASIAKYAIQKVALCMVYRILRILRTLNLFE